MSILKNLKKNKSKMDIRKGSQVIANINKLREMKLLEVDFAKRKFSIQPELWDGKDLKFKDNWCRAIAVYWDATTNQKTTCESFDVLDKTNGQALGYYNLKDGFYPFSGPGSRQ